jgi:MOSC domain-containing protein YiiM
VERKAVVRVVSLNVGAPRLVAWRGRMISTGIFKDAVSGPVHVAGVNFDGDRQADAEVHGGPDKAVYVYPAEHYPYWRTTLDRPLPWGMFGENLTVEDVPLEDEIAIGDRLRIGSAEFLVTQPRLPCFKLGIRFDDASIVRRFLEAERTGYYLRIAAEGEVEAGNKVEVLERDPAAVTVAEITRVFTREHTERGALRRLLGASVLPDSWRLYVEQLLEQPAGAASTRLD